MAFYDVVDHVRTLLQRRGRVSYRALKRQLDLDEAFLDDVRVELIDVQRCAVDHEGLMLVWAGDAGVGAPATADAPADGGQARVVRAETPAHLTDKTRTARSTLEGERKQVTVLFADIKGSTELIEGLDPEEARKLLDPALQLMMEAVHRYGGTVNQVLGDGIMALFGAPLAHEDHAVRACYAALSLQAAMQHYADQTRRTHGVTLPVRLGLNTGEVVVRTISNDLHMDYSAVGPAVHLAARMEQLALPGTILLTAATFRLVEGVVQVQALGPVPIKGLAEPVEVFELTGASAVHRRLQVAASRGLTHFVGRQAELDTLCRALGQVYGGQGCLVTVLGEPGVGKSRLVYECINAHCTQGWLILESTAVSYGRTMAYLPVIDLLKRYLHLDEHDTPRTVQAKVTWHLLSLDETLRDAIPPLLSLFEALPGDSPFLALDPVQRRQHILEAVTRVLVCESQMQPVMLIFEDLHWVDSETQALLERLVAQVATASLCLLVTYRPEYPHDWGDHPWHIPLRLSPLPPEGAEALLQGLLGDESGLAPLKRLLIERTAGNPFFLEESVRALVETAALVGERGAYRLTSAVPAIQVPATVQAVLAARIDRLPADAKELLQTAAVIGTEVPLLLLQVVVAWPDDALQSGLGALHGAEFLFEARLFPEHVYAFTHALTHEVAYASLLRERRRALHAQIVLAIEALAGDRLADQVERLAHHAWQGEVWDKALQYFPQAGARALERSAHQEAVAHFERALVALQHLPEQRRTQELAIDLRFNLRTALLPLGAGERIATALQEAETLAERLGDSQRLGQVALYMTIHFYGIGTYDRALTSGQRALALAGTSEDGILRAVANTYLGLTYQALGAYQQAIACCQDAVVSLSGDLRSERLGQVFLPAVFSRSLLAWCLAEVGAFAESSAAGAAGLEIAEAAEHPASLMRASFGVGVSYLMQGDYQPAIPPLERALAMCRSVGLPVYLPDIATALGTAYALAGRSDEAIALLEPTVIQAQATGRAQLQAHALAALSEAYCLAARLEEAGTLAEQALTLCRQQQEHGDAARLLRLLGVIAAHRYPVEVAQAAAYLQQALALATELGMRPLQAHCHRDLGLLYRQEGRLAQASAELSTAATLYRTMAMTYWLPQVETALRPVRGAVH